jgi:hypothetical protein
MEMKSSGVMNGNVCCEEAKYEEAINWGRNNTIKVLAE